MSKQYYVETSVIIGLNGDLINESADRILFGGVAIKVQSSSPESGYRENMLINVKTTKRVFKKNIPEVGCCPCGEIYLEMHMPKTNFERKAEIIPYVRLVSDSDENDKSEWIRKGVFYIDTRDNSHNDDNLDILTLHGYDSLIKANQDYGEYYDTEEFEITTQEETGSTVPHWTKVANQQKWTAYVTSDKVINKDITIEYTGDESIAFSQYVTFSHIKSSNTVNFIATSSPLPNLFCKLIIRKDDDTLAFPAKDVDVVKDIAKKIDVDVDEESIAFMVEQRGSNPYYIEYPSEYTMIETLGYIGAMFGGNWIVNDIGDLQLIPLWALPKETYLITNEIGYRITFGTDPEDGKAIRIKIFDY